MEEWSFRKELARKFVHFLSISVLFVYFIIADLFSRQLALLILVFVLVVFLEIEYIRIEIGNRIPLLNKILNYYRREKEREKLGGDVFFLIGAIVVLSVFDLRIAMAAILMTIFGDLAAALIGSRFGKHYLSFLKNRAWEGIIAEFFVDLIAGAVVFFVISGFSVYTFQPWSIILVMSLVATFVETIIYKMDDNLLIPVFAGFSGQIISLLFSYFL